MRFSAHLLSFLIVILALGTPQAGDLNLNEIFKSGGSSSITTSPSKRRPSTRRPRRYIRSMKNAVQLDIPIVSKQDDSWSCGINASAMVLNYYGHDVTYEGLREERKDRFKIPKTIPILNKIPTGTIPVYRLGTHPSDVKAILGAYRKKIRVRKHTSLNLIKAVLNSKKPVIALIRPKVKTIKIKDLVEIQQPNLHWIVVSGYNNKNSKIYYYDTYAKGEEEMSESEFLEEWDWDIPGMGALGVHSRTVVY